MVTMWPVAAARASFRFGDDEACYLIFRFSDDAISAGIAEERAQFAAGIGDTGWIADFVYLEKCFEIVRMIWAKSGRHVRFVARVARLGNMPFR